MISEGDFNIPLLKKTVRLHEAENNMIYEQPNF